jgi:hypothetical protein
MQGYSDILLRTPREDGNRSEPRDGSRAFRTGQIDHRAGSAHFFSGAFSQPIRFTRHPGCVLAQTLRGLDAGIYPVPRSVSQKRGDKAEDKSPCAVSEHVHIPEISSRICVRQDVRGRHANRLWLLLGVGPLIDILARADLAKTMSLMR